MKKRILTADDEMDVLMLLETRLSASGYEVLKATDGIAALDRARADQPALAVLDVMMPGMSGLEVCRALKADPKTARMPIIMLTARHEEVDRVLGFEFGADDYVLKPFSPRELALRIQALLRHQLHPVAAPSALVTLGPISVDRFAHRVTVQKRTVDLTRTEFKLLSTLIEVPGRVLSREELPEAVWPAQANIEIRTVEVQGFEKGPVARHGCPSHGIGLTPDEKEVWVRDAANRRMHVFDATATPPWQVASLAVREEPGWVTFGIDGHFAYPSTGDVIDVATRQIIARLTDEHGAAVQSEKMLEIDFAGSRAVRAGCQFGVGAVH